eukprot:15218559-Ditylum_brightwellii.AAC.1
MSGEETIQSKWAYERVVALQWYHSDNGHFDEKDFCDACEAQGQKITFCGVDAHHQNRVAENGIKLLTLKVQTMVLHAKKH